MKFGTHTARSIHTAMSSYMGEIEIDYATLVAIFGEPLEGGDKTDAEWQIQFHDGEFDLEDGTIATIYNWKDGHNYLGEAGLAVGAIKDWHVGGYSPLAHLRVLEAITAFNKKTLKLQGNLAWDKQHSTIIGE